MAHFTFKLLNVGERGTSTRQITCNMLWFTLQPNKEKKKICPKILSSYKEPTMEILSINNK